MTHRVLIHSTRFHHYMPLAQFTDSSPSNLQEVFDNALQAYEKQTKIDLLALPLAAQLQSCKSPSAILALLREQVHGQDQPRDSDERWIKWLYPVVDVLNTLSMALGERISLVCLGISTVLIPVPHVSSAGYLTSEDNFYRCRRSPFGMYPS